MSILTMADFWEQVQSDLEAGNELLMENYEKYSSILDKDDFDFDIFYEDNYAYLQDPQDTWCPVPFIIQRLIKLNLLKEVHYSFGNLLHQKGNSRIFRVVDQRTPPYFQIIVCKADPVELGIDFAFMTSTSRNFCLDKSEEIKLEELLPKLTRKNKTVFSTILNSQEYKERHKFESE